MGLTNQACLSLPTQLQSIETINDQNYYDTNIVRTNFKTLDQNVIHHKIIKDTSQQIPFSLYLL